MQTNITAWFQQHEERSSHNTRRWQREDTMLLTINSCGEPAVLTGVEKLILQA